MALGPLLSLVFENRDTVRFQIQEMARAERILTDEGIQAELDVYNPLIPQPGQLSATVFLELTTEAELRHWLPRLVGIERALVLRLGPQPGDARVRCSPEEAHAGQLTRQDTTASVHYVRFEVGEHVARAVRSELFLVSEHPEYRHEVHLSEPTRAELLADLAG